MAFFSIFLSFLAFGEHPFEPGTFHASRSRETKCKNPSG